MSGHPFIKALAAYWGGAFVQGLRCHFISMPGKSPMKLEVTSRYDHSCLLGRKASKQTNKQNQYHLDVFLSVIKIYKLVPKYMLKGKRRWVRQICFEYLVFVSDPL